jgi:hypothetical protein
MPEAAVQKNGEFRIVENEIGFAHQMIIAPPARNLRFSQQVDKL